jgi:rhodanese-related sulfurtransferase
VNSARRAVKGLLAEAVLVAAAGAILAFAANGLSPRGLQLRRDVFFLSAQPSTNATRSNSPTASQPTNQLSPLESLAAALQAEGLRVADSNLVAQLFHDPRCQQDLVVFLDARPEEDYQAGHIPGAYAFDYQKPEKYISTVLPACQAAQQVLVYCNGGDCELSHLAARTLSQWGVPKEKLFVYGGGITEWTNNRMPFEIGERRSGNVHQY